MRLVDVVVCGHNEGAYIGRALDSLVSQTLGADGYGVVVVDNASTDSTHATVERYQTDLDLKYVFEPRLGLNRARNAGVRQAPSDYVAFLDADAQAHPLWIERIVDVLRQQELDLCGGPYYPYYITPKPAWFQDRYNMMSLGDQPHFLSANEYLSGSNMVWRRRTLEALGGFREGIGSVGRRWTPGDETELIVRARGQIPNFKAYYDPDIIVYHLTRPEAYRLRYHVRRSFARGRVRRVLFRGGHGLTVHRLTGRGRQRLRGIYRGMLALSRAAIAGDPSEFPRLENVVFEVLMPLSLFWGYVYGWLEQALRPRQGQLQPANPPTLKTPHGE